MLRKVMMWVLVTVFLVGIAAVYGGVGWGIAWLLEKVFSVGVNYSAFVLVGIGLFVLTAIPYILFLMAAKRQKQAETGL